MAEVCVEVADWSTHSALSAPETVSSNQNRRNNVNRGIVEAR